MISEVVYMVDGREIYFTMEKVKWHWCIYRHEKQKDASKAKKMFQEWYFTKFMAKRSLDSLVKHYNRLNDKMRFHQNYEKHLKALLEKEDVQKRCDGMD